jgi:hypothetical protein
VVAVIAAATCAAPAACGRRDHGAPAISADSVGAPLASVLAPELERMIAAAEGIDSLLHPLPLLTPAEEVDLRRFGNADHLARAARLGALPANAAARQALVAEGRLVPLEEQSDHWVLRRLDHSVPLLTPDARDMLVLVATRFHAALAERGLPPFRLEITSALRTAEQQADLRRTNTNAAGGRSTHEYGTTVDIAYSGFAAPRADLVASAAAGAEAAAPQLRMIADVVLERIAARRSRELQAILGYVLRELQSEGALLVTLERQQPVYHLTVARTAR